MTNCYYSNGKIKRNRKIFLLNFTGATTAQYSHTVYLCSHFAWSIVDQTPSSSFL